MRYARKAVADIQLLHFPIPVKVMYLDTDASLTGCVTCLYHVDVEMCEQNHSLAFTCFQSRCISLRNHRPRGYSVILALNGLEPLLLGQHFVIRINRRNLLRMEHFVNARVQRWFGYI